MKYRHTNGGTPPPPPELQMALNFFNKFKFPLIIGFLIFVGARTTFYTVEPDEEAVVIRLGQYIKTEGPGLNFKIPFGVDEVTKVKTKTVHQLEFGFKTIDAGPAVTKYAKREYVRESLMLTGDLNVADVEWVVQYQISDPFKYLFRTSQPVKNIRDISESIMRRVVGDRLVTEVLTTGRAEIASDAKVLMQEVLDKYDMGIRITTIKLQDVNPPKAVQASFNEVNSAKQEQEKMLNQAEKSYNRVIPEAKGKAEQLIAEAEGYAQEKVNRAQGDTQRFDELASEYNKAPAITEKRIYLETMEKLYKRMKGITIVDQKVKGLLPVFSKQEVIK